MIWSLENDVFNKWWLAKKKEVWWCINACKQTALLLFTPPSCPRAWTWEITVVRTPFITQKGADITQLKQLSWISSAAQFPFWKLWLHRKWELFYRHCYCFQLFSRVWFFEPPWTAACQASLSFTISQSLLKLMSIESVMPSNHLILCRPLLLLPSIFPSISIFSNESVLHIRRSKYQSFSCSISPSSEYSGLISFMMDWLDLLVVQGTLKSLQQHHSSKASILRYSAFFMGQFSHAHRTTGKTVTLSVWTFVGKIMFLLFNTLSRFVIAFFQGGIILNSWLQSPSTVILEPKKGKSHCFHCFPIYLPWSDGTRCHVLSFLNSEF